MGHYCLHLGRLYWQGASLPLPGPAVVAADMVVFTYYSDGAFEHLKRKHDTSMGHCCLHLDRLYQQGTLLPLPRPAIVAWDIVAFTYYSDGAFGHFAHYLASGER